MISVCLACFSGDINYREWVPKRRLFAYNFDAQIIEILLVLFSWDEDVCMVWNFLQNNICFSLDMNV